MTETEIQAAMAALRRPVPQFYSIGAIKESVAELRDWDAANPEAAAQWHAFAAQLEALDAQKAAEAVVRRFEERAPRTLVRSGAGERSLAAARAPDETEAIAATRGWLRQLPPSWALVLRGDVGTGKTVAAHWAMLHVARLGKSAELRSGSQVVRISGFDGGAKELAKLKRVGLLVIDDIGSETLTEYGRGNLVDLLNARYEAKALTVITANPTWPQLTERLGQRIVDRIQHGGALFEIAGKSMRGAA